MLTVAICAIPAGCCKQQADTVPILLQIFLSRVDQRLHGKDLPEAASTAAAIADIEKPMAVFPFAASGAPVHTRYDHYCAIFTQAPLKCLVTKAASICG